METLGGGIGVYQKVEVIDFEVVILILLVEFM